MGANLGVYTLLDAALLQGRGKVHSLEPTPGTYRILRDNVPVNGFLQLELVRFYQKAVTDRAGVARFWTFNSDCGHDTLFDDTRADGAIEVTTISLDQAFTRSLGEAGRALVDKHDINWDRVIETLTS